MRSGEARLAVDCGSVGTTAVVAWSDGTWSPLVFDGQPVLSSAVFLSPDGTVLTGQQAWQAAVAQPDRFIPAPRRSPEQQVTGAGAEVDAVELVAATLRRIHDEAQRVVGGPIEDVRLVVPAGWGPRRRTWMRQAAHRAGLSQPRLVEAPVAVASHLLAAGVQLPVGSFIVVCDVGGGAEVTVLRRGPAGFEVLSTLSDPSAGGVSVDEALIATVTSSSPDSVALDGARWAVTASVQAAKHALADNAAVTVPLPAGPAVVMNTSLLEQAAEPVLRRAGRLVSEAVAAAEVDPAGIAGIWCVGGVASMSLAEKILIEEVGQAAVVVADPASAAVRGAADAGPAVAGGEASRPESPPVPPVRRAVAVAVPGFASLGLVSQFLFTAVWNGGTVHPWALLNWGELAMAAVFAVIASLGAGTLIASALPAGGCQAPGLMESWLAGFQGCSDGVGHRV